MELSNLKYDLEELAYKPKSFLNLQKAYVLWQKFYWEWGYNCPEILDIDEALLEIGFAGINIDHDYVFPVLGYFRPGKTDEDVKNLTLY